MAEFTYNDHLQSAIGHSPFFMNYGHHPWKGLANIPSHPNETATEFITRMHTIREEAQASLRHAQENMSRFHTRKHTKSIIYKPKDKVWLEGTNLSTNRPAKKLDHKRHGPFEVVSVHGKAYKLKLPNTWKMVHPVFHETLLSPYHPPAFSSQEKPQPPLPDLIDTIPEYEIDFIVKARKWGRGLRFLVHWKGYPHEDDTWEPQSNLSHAKDALADFYRKNP